MEGYPGPRLWAVAVAVEAAVSNSTRPAQAAASALRQVIAVLGAYPHHDEAYTNPGTRLEVRDLPLTLTGQVIACGQQHCHRPIV
jgi:hypothetical protein